jgi:hypothetical protein
MGLRPMVGVGQRGFAGVLEVSYRVYEDQTSLHILTLEMLYGIERARITCVGCDVRSGSIITWIAVPGGYSTAWRSYGIAGWKFHLSLCHSASTSLILALLRYCRQKVH